MGIVRRVAGAVGTGWAVLGLSILLLLALEGAYRAQGAVRTALVGSAPPAHPYADSAWYHDLSREQEAANRLRWRPYVYFRREAFAGALLNIDSAGHRRTVQSSLPGAALVLTFGGSTMFGADQRDERTIASGLARSLDGKVPGGVEVRNLGETGYVFTQGVLELELQLRSGVRPAVVVFYDGINDVASAVQNREAGLPQNEINRARDFALGRQLFAWETGIDDELRAVSAAGLALAQRIHVVRRLRQLLPAPAEPPYDADTLALAVARLYGGTVELVEALAGAYGFVPLYAWQPSLHGSTKPRTPFEASLMARLDASPFHRAMVDVHRAAPGLLRRHLPASAVPRFLDLSGVFADDSSAVFTDLIGHTTERANDRIVSVLAPHVERALANRRRR